jgi:diaminopimelate decarboxylase
MAQRQFPFDLALLSKIVRLYETPLQLYDGYNMKLNAENFISIFKKYIPGFKQFFAVKALPNPNILKLLVDMGMGLDCSSFSELKLAQMIGVPGDSIMFTSNYTSTSDLKYALEQNVIINLDDISLITDLYYINNKLPSKLFLRFNPGIGRTDSETKSNVLGGPDAKFGMDTESIIQSCILSKSLGVQEFGIHMMTGSNVTNLDYWEELIDKLFELLDKLNQLNISVQYINLGGGIGIDYKTGIPLDIESLAIKIGNKITENCQKYQLVISQIYMENGRFITGPYGYLITKCNCVKQLYGKTFYGLDACMSNLMRPGMYNSYHHITVIGKDSVREDEKHEANVVGTLCENNDWFAKDRKLPLSKPGDYFVIWDTGAHSHSMGFQYNGKLRASEVLINNDTFKLIRRRESFDDYINTVIFYRKQPEEFNWL